MSRPEAKAVAGFFPTPEPVLPMIAALFMVPEPKNRYDSVRSWHLVDPCAGEGTAAFALATAIGGNSTVYAAELERTRFDAMCGARGRSRTFLNGDAFHIEFTPGIAQLLYLNPPYDTDSEHGRLEERWLERFTGALSVGGLLVDVVPHYALAASAQTLAIWFEELECFRFPDSHFADYKQVVLVGRKRPARREPDRDIIELVETWARDPATAVPLRAAARMPKREIQAPPSGMWSPTWKVRPFDSTGLLSRFKPWRRTGAAGRLESVAGVVPLGPIAELAARKFPVATPPRPAHMAAGIASGLFNGRRVASRHSTMPDLLVKGTFERAFVQVEEKRNEDDDLVGVVEVQQPKLTITVLDLSTARFSTLKPGGITGTRVVSEMTFEDLLDSYGPDLSRVLAEQCPVTYDPSNPDPGLELAPVARPLFSAQAHAARALYGLLGGPDGDSRGKVGILLGEIGVGKTSVALAVANTMANRVLVVCPPHLLDGWRGQVGQVLADARFTVLKSLTDVDDFAALPRRSGLDVAVLSREAAKLGHGYGGVTCPRCPRCGARVTVGVDELSRRRVTCAATTWAPMDPLAFIAEELALKLVPYAPLDGTVADVVRSRIGRKYRKKLATIEAAVGWTGLPPRLLRRLATIVVERSLEGNEEAIKVLPLLALEMHEGDIALTIDAIFEKGVSSVPYMAIDVARLIVACMPDGEVRDRLAAIAWKNGSYHVTGLAEMRRRAIEEEAGAYSSVGKFRLTDGVPSIGGMVGGSLELALAVIEYANRAGSWELSKACGEPLYQAVPDPRRYPLASYIHRRHRHTFDFLIIDEAHEQQGITQSAQGIAGARLSGLGWPTIRMTGSLMNGYSSSCFGTMWLSSPGFRSEFARNEEGRFVAAYGYRKRLVQDVEEGDVVGFGSVSDRVVRRHKMLGEAPGVLPLFLFRHMLSASVTLQKSDLGAHIPPLTQHVERVKLEPGSELERHYRHLLNSTLEQIKKDRFDETGKSGILYGALAQLGTYLDRAAVGPYEVRYPEKFGGEIVAKAPGLDPAELLPKEEWLLDRLELELAEGRNVMVFVWSSDLFPRLERLIANHFRLTHLRGKPPAVLLADKVATSKREMWIDKHVVAAGARVLLVNPVCVQTGLNNLVHFATEVFYQDPANNPTTARQAVGRIDRLGARKPTRVYWPVYTGSIQVPTHELLLRKIAVATAADGLDPESVLLAAGGAEDGYLAGLSLGRELYAVLERRGATVGTIPARRMRRRCEVAL